jgi:dethiobiotin synthetase
VRGNRSSHRQLSPFRVFVTATDTGVGKTQTAVALLALLADAGHAPAPFKPYESGCKDLRRPADALALKRAARSEDPLERICPHRFKEPVAPGIAARREGVEPSFARTLAAYRGFDGRSLVAEGAGGLFVPVDSRHDVIDLIAELGLPVVLVARAGLGTLNHTALSLGALAGRDIPVRAVLLSKSARGADASEEDNARELQRRHGVTVLGPVPFVRDPKRRAAAFRQAVRPLLGRFSRR